LFITFDSAGFPKPHRFRYRAWNRGYFRNKIYARLLKSIMKGKKLPLPKAKIRFWDALGWFFKTQMEGFVLIHLMLMCIVLGSLLMDIGRILIFE
jgi:hypothetical protein